MNLLEENKFIRKRNPKKKFLEKPLMSNGSEFLKDFDQYLDNSSIPHYFTLPHSPRINGIVERFNRTIQEEFLNLTDSMAYHPKRFSLELKDWLSWYNMCRPHASLNYQTPWEFLKASQSQM